MTRIILGGGLGGLSAAYYSLKRFPHDKLLLLEASNRTGGWVKTNKINSDTLFEYGPRTIRPKGDAARNTLELIENLNLQNEILSIKSNHPAATNRMLYVNGKLHKLPSKLTSLFKRTPPFTEPIIFALFKDMWTSKKVSPINDESIYDFAKRRFGEQIADYLVSPMICGICAGNAKEISVKFLLESWFNYEQKYGSISRGMLATFRKNKPTAQKLKSNLANRALAERWSIYTFKNGMEILPETLTNHLTDNGVSICLNENCKSIIFKNGEVIVNTDKKTYIARDILSGIPAKKLGKLIESQHSILSNLLQSIPTVDVAIINLKYNGNLIPEEAFGYLIPPNENIPILGVIYDSCCKSQLESTTLTVMIGGYCFEKFLGKDPSEEKLLNITLDHLKESLNINEKPNNVNVNILRECIPQYIVGHNERLNQINNYIKEKRLPIKLCGASYYGVGVNDVILSSKKAVDALDNTN